MTAREARRIDPLAYQLRRIRCDAALYVYRVRQLILSWPEAQC